MAANLLVAADDGVELALARQGPDGAGEEQDGSQGHQQGEAVDLVFLVVGLLLLRLGAGEDVHAPENGRQADEQRHVGDVVDERVGHHFRAGPAFGAEHEGKNEVAHAGAVGHDEGAEDGAFDAALGHGFQPPDHQEGGGNEEAKETPRRHRAGAFHPC